MVISIIILLFICLFLSLPIFISKEDDFGSILLLIASVSIIAICKTQFETIFSVMVVVFLYWFASKRVKFNFEVTKDSKQLLLFSIIAVFLYWLIDITCYTHFFQVSYVSMKHPDYVFYSNAAKFVMENGIETKLINPLDLSLTDEQPLHYLEIWLTGFVANLFSLNYHTVLMLITFNVFKFILFMLYFKLSKKYILNNFYAFIIAFFAVFMSTIDLQIGKFVSLFSDLNIYTNAPFNYMKLLIIQMFVLAFLVSYIKTKKIEIVKISLLSVCFYTCLPAIGILILLSIYYSYQKNIKNLINIENIIALIVVFWVLLFYKFHSKYPINLFEGVNFFDPLYLKTFVNINIGATIQILYAFCIPLILVLFVLKKQIHLDIKLLILLFLPVPPCLFIWGVLFKQHDSVQVFSNYFVSTINVFFIYCIILVFEYWQKKWLKLSLLVCMIGVSALNISKHISKIDPFSEKLQSVINENSLIGVIMSKVTYQNPFMSDIYFATGIPQVNTFKNNVKFINLSTNNLPLEPTDWQLARKLNFQKNSEWFHFYSKYNQYNPHIIDKFCKLKKIDYLYIEDDVFDDLELQSKFKLRLLLEKSKIYEVVN